jgi:CheY-like chemotaxis protein
VDDDRTLRKLVSRSLRKVAPSWAVSEASSGETALRMVTESDYDLIFMDQYMASGKSYTNQPLPWLHLPLLTLIEILTCIAAGHSLKGTETTRALRANRVRSFICGLSANDMESNFIGCGADAFLLKPFPCRPGELRKTLEDFAGRVESDSMA